MGMLVALLGGVGLVLYASAQIRRVPVANLRGGGGPLHVLVVGSDSREGLTAKQRKKLHTGSVGGARTDTLFIMTISGARMGLLALPRDLYVTDCDGSEARINTVLAVGGRSCLVETVQDLSGIPLDHYLEVRFLGFHDLVEAVGGVTVCLDRPIDDEDAGIDLPAGCQRLDGRQALGYARVRKIDSDLKRIERQQRFLRALASRVLSPSTLLNPVRLVRTADRTGDALTADRRLGPLTLSRIAVAAPSLTSKNAVTATVPTRSVSGVGMVPTDEADTLFARFRTGSVLSARGGPRPSEITVAVLNGTGIDDLASRTAAHLRDVGFHIDRIANATQTVGASLVRYPPDAHDEATMVAATLPGESRLEETTAVTVVTVVLGPDAAGS